MARLSPYTPAQKTTAFRLRAQGFSYKTISKKTKIPAMTIGMWIRKAMTDCPRKYKHLKFKAIR